VVVKLSYTSCNWCTCTYFWTTVSFLNKYCSAASDICVTGLVSRVSEVSIKSSVIVVGVRADETYGMYVYRPMYGTFRGFRAQKFYLKKYKFRRKRVFVFCKFYFVILPTRSDNNVGLYWFLHPIRIVSESSFQLCIFKVANLKKLWQFWQKCVDRTFVHGTLDLCSRIQPYSLDCHGGAMGMYRCALENTTDRRSQVVKLVTPLPVCGLLT